MGEEKLLEPGFVRATLLAFSAVYFLAGVMSMALATATQNILFHCIEDHPVCKVSLLASRKEPWPGKAARS
ncbi:MAG TPA: hypothetical protein PKM21_06000 [Anaerolineales bacterium]|nr:hypothetical protein [Anaerolineales bacterium]